jgi:hypothetical protein
VTVDHGDAGCSEMFEPSFLEFNPSSEVTLAFILRYKRNNSAPENPSQ